MDYEKAYKKALETARDFLDFYKDNPAQAQKFIDIFPELTESEDERMIKWLHYLIEIAYTTDLAWDIPKEDALAWLEKQKEQKPVEYLSKQRVFAIMNKLTDLSYSELIPIDSEEYVKIHEITSDVNSLLDYPIKQKPSWSEEDEETMQDLINLLWILQGISNMKPGTASKYTQWLKSLRPQPHWKPSEEQMKALHNFAYTNFFGDGDCDALRSLYEDLKKL